MVERVDVFAVFSKAVRSRYKDRVAALWALSDNPYEKGDDETVYVVVEMKDGHTMDDIDTLSALAFQAQEQVEQMFDVVPFILDSGDKNDLLARIVDLEGVRL